MSKRLSFSIAINLLTENFKKGANAVKNAFKSMQMQILTFATALGAGGLGLAGLLSKFKDVARETSRVTTALRNVSVGTSGFADNLKFINGLAKEYGLEVNSLISNFSKFTASATQANMPMKDQKKIFESLSKASAAFSLSGEQTDGVFLALSQMMGKGKISMEELRKQMGEKLPIAMSAMAKALGVSISEMDKLVSAGKVMAADVLPKFADALNEMIPEIDTDNLESSLNKLSNAFGEIVDSSGFTNKYKALIDGLTSLLETAASNIKTIFQGVASVIIGLAAMSATKVWNSWSRTTKSLTTGSAQLEAQLASATAARVSAQNKLEDARLKHSVAVGRSKLLAAQKVTVAEKILAQSALAEDRATLALQNVPKTTKWQNFFDTIKTGAKKVALSLRVMWSSFAPMIIVTAITMIGQKIYELATATTKAEDAMVDFNAEAMKESKNLNSLFDAYRKANEGTDGKKRLLGEIKSKYGAYIKDLIDEKGHIKDIEEAQKRANTALRQSIALKVKNAAVGSVQEEGMKKQADLISDIRKITTKSKGEDVANRTMDSISKLINSSDLSPKDLAEQMKAILEKEGIKKTETASLFGGDVQYKTAMLAKIIDNVKKETKDIENSFKGLIGDFEEPIEPEKKIITNNNDNDSAKTKDNRQKVIDDELKYQNAKARAELDARNKELENQQELLNLDQDGFDKQQKQIDLNHQKEILGIDTRTQDLIEKQQDAERQLWDIEHPDASKTKELFRTKTNSYTDLSDANKSELITSDDIATKQREKAESDLLKNLLEKYQDYNIQRTKLEKNYNEEISFLESRRNETNSKAIDAATAELEKQKIKALSSINLEEFQDSIDWNTVFGNLDRVSTNALQGVREKLKNYLIEAGNSLAPTDLKTITDAIEQMNIEIADREPINELKSSYKGYKNALVEVIAAKEKLKGLEEGTSEYTKATKELSDAEKKRRASLTVMSQSVNSFGQKGNQIVSSGNEIIDMLGAFGVEVDENVAKTLAGVGQIMSGLQNIDLNKPFSIVTSSITMLTGAGKAIAGVFGLFGGGDNNRYLKMKEQYESLNKVWDELITKKKEYISTSYGEEARKVGEEAKRLTEKQVESNRELGKAYMNSFKNKTGSSWGVRQQSRIKGNDWQDLDTWKNLNNISDDLFNSVTTGRMTGLFDLTAEQLESLKEEAPSLWAKLEDQTKEYLNNIIDGGERLEDINKSLKEQYTQLSLDSFKDSYVDMLSDMDSSNQDLADNFEKYIQKAILSSLIGTKYKKQIESLYDDFANANSDGNIDVSEATALKKKQEELAAQMLAERDKLKETFGWESDNSKSQDSSKGYSVSMDQDTGGAILGRVTGLHETGLRMEAFLKNISLDTSNYLSQSVSIANELKKQTDILNDSFQIHKKSYFKIESISEGMEVLGDVKDRLTQIEKNTKGLVSK